MTYQLVLTGKFKKGLKRAKKRGLDIELLDTVVDKLIHGLSLDDKYRDCLLYTSSWKMVWTRRSCTWKSRNPPMLRTRCSW